MAGAGKEESERYPFSLFYPATPRPGRGVGPATMFTLLSGLYDLATAREEVRLLIIGLDAAGKTTLLNALTQSSASASMPATRPPVGLTVGRLDVGGCSVMLWDLGGASGLRTIWER